MERIQKTTTTTTTTYYEDGINHCTPTVIVRELEIEETTDDDIFDPELTPHTLNVPIIHHDISDTESVSADETDHHYDRMDDNWFPSLSKASWIQDLDKTDSGDEDTLMTDRTMETLFASEIVEINDDDVDGGASIARHERPKQWTNHGSVTLNPMDKNDMNDDDMVDSISYRSLDVPIDVVYVLND